MYSVLKDYTYEVVIESVDIVVVGSKKFSKITGWAVDTLRKTTPKLSVISDSISIERCPRPDVQKKFNIEDGDNAGFTILAPVHVWSLKMRCTTPGRSIVREINPMRVKASLTTEHARKRMSQLSFYATHVWNKEGMSALSAAVKRRFVKEKSFYEQWIQRHETMTAQDAEKLSQEFKHTPLISIVTPVYNVDEVWLRKCVDSVLGQWYTNWELCLADDCSPSPHVKPLLEEFARRDPRIKIVFREENGQISEATNSAIALASGDYIGFMDNDDELAPQALFEVVRALNENPEIDFFYSDEDKITEQDERFDPFFKPGYSPHLLLGQNYITHFVVVSKDLLHKVGWLRSEYDGSQDYDFVLRATEQAHCVHHIPQMLYHWRTLASSVAGDPRSKMYAYEAGRKAIESALQRREIPATVSMLDNLGTYKVDYDFSLPSVAVLASSYSDAQLKKLRELTDYSDVTFVAVDSTTVNEIAMQRKEQLLVLLDGLKPKERTWLREMVNYLHDSSVGAVGGKIYDVHDRVMNVGITLRALKNGNAFEMRGEWDEGIGYYFRGILPRDIFAVTEDCLLISQQDFAHLGGLNMRYPSGIRGIDLCERLYRQANKTVLWQPYSQFVDAKRKPLELKSEDVVSYLKLRRKLEDPFASACFPKSPQQENIKCVIDRVQWSADYSKLSVVGWAADLHGDEEIEFSLSSDDGVMLREVQRLARPDVNASYPVSPNANLGFRLVIDVTGGPKTLHNSAVDLVCETTVDRKSVPLHTQASVLGTKIAAFLHKAALLAHPRRTLRVLKDRYWVPVQQRRAYQSLIKRTERYNERAVHAEISKFTYQPVISFVVPVYNVDEQWLRACVKSVQNQYYRNWELCLADDHSSAPHVRPLLEELSKSDPRIKVGFREENGHISRASNSALELASGDYVALLDNDDELAPQALYEVVRCLNENPDLDLIYSDEDKITEDGQRFSPHFKPDYSPDLLMSTNYISHLGVYRKSIVDEIGGFRTGYEGSQDYDLVLRFVEHTCPERIKHISKVLYHWRTLATSTASSGNAKSYTSDAGLRALESMVERRGIRARVESAGPNGIYNMHYDVDESDLVSVIIPTKNGYDNIERCVNSIIEKTDYANYEIIIADNGSSNPHMFTLYDDFAKRLGERFRVESIDIPFNFSRINNLAAKTARGKYLLFLNDDTEVISRLWVTRMVSFAQMTRVGVVGAKLYYPIETIQHAGIVLGLGGVAGHISVGTPRGDFGYFGRLIENVNFSAVTAACCMVKAEDFWNVGGFDENLAVAYNDVDFCLRIRQLGRDNVWAHEAELYHYESITRGYDVESRKKKQRLAQESEKMRAKYESLIEDDPYYNPNLSRTSGNYWIREK